MVRVWATSPGQGMQIGRGLGLCHHALKDPEVLGHVVAQHQDLLLLAEQALIAGKSHALPPASARASVWRATSPDKTSATAERTAAVSAAAITGQSR